MNSLFDAGAHGCDCLLLGGPTASGKSEIALKLAERLGGEIVSVDSMQVYRGMDIGTAKPSLTEQKRVPHHLIDILQLHESYDAARFLHCAREACMAIRDRGRLPILCGGTGLYFKVFQEGLCSIPSTDAGLRAELVKIPLSELLAELQQHDPLAYERIARQNPRRVVRAVEVIRLSGKPFSSFRKDWQQEPHAKGLHPVNNFFCLTRETEDMRARIDRRVDQMFEAGLVEETRHLLERGLENNPIALQALGYRDVTGFLRGSVRSLPETVRLVKTHTRQFAKRQRTWFRHQAEVRWVPVGKDTDLEQVAEQIEQIWSAPKK